MTPDHDMLKESAALREVIEINEITARELSNAGAPLKMIKQLEERIHLLMGAAQRYDRMTGIIPTRR